MPPHRIHVPPGRSLAVFGDVHAGAMHEDEFHASLRRDHADECCNLAGEQLRKMQGQLAGVVLLGNTFHNVGHLRDTLNEQRATAQLEPLLAVCTEFHIPLTVLPGDADPFDTERSSATLRQKQGSVRERVHALLKSPGLQYSLSTGAALIHMQKNTMLATHGHPLALTNVYIPDEYRNCRDPHDIVNSLMQSYVECGTLQEPALVQNAVMRERNEARQGLLELFGQLALRSAYGRPIQYAIDKRRKKWNIERQKTTIHGVSAFLNATELAAPNMFLLGHAREGVVHSWKGQDARKTWLLNPGSLTGHGYLACDAPGSFLLLHNEQKHPRAELFRQYTGGDFFPKSTTLD